MSDIQDYQRLTITSLRDPSSGKFAIHDYERDLSALVSQAVKSALPEGAYFSVGNKSIDKSTGEMKVDVYVHSEDANVVRQSLNNESEKLQFKGSKGQSDKYAITSSAVTREEAVRMLQAEKDKNRVEPEHTKKIGGTIMKVLGVLTALTDITRRILSSVLTFATQTTKDMTTAHNLGMSYEAVRSYRHTETVHGLKEGTITGAISDIQSKFGNITSLDEKALEALAVVMGGKIEEMATMGLGASNPEKVLGSILDTFNEKANAGYNSVGQYVGEQQARRELYSYLLKISPQIADIFATMQEEQHNINSLYRNQADTFEEWKNLVPTMRGGNTSMDYNVTSTLGQEWGVIKDLVSKIKESIVVSIAPALLSILRRISNIRTGLSESENRRVNEENKLANEIALNKVKAQMEEIKANWGSTTQAEKDYYSALQEYSEELTKALEGNRKGDVDNVVRTSEEVRVMANAITKKNANQALASSVTINRDGSISAGAVSGVTLADVKDVLSAYPSLVNVEKLNKEYLNALDEANRKVDKARKDYITRRNVQLEGEFAKGEGKDADKWYSKTGVKNRPKGKDIGHTEKRQYELLAKAWYIYGADSGINLESLQTGSDIRNAYLSAVDAGYINGGRNLDEAKVSAYPKIKGIAEDEARAKFTYSGYNEDDFYWWLYNLNSSKLNPHIVGKKTDEIIASSVTANRFASTFMMKELDYGKIIPKTYKGEGTVVGYNDRSNGEVEHVIVFKYEDKDGTVKEFELGRWLGMTGYEGELGTLNVTKSGGKTDYTFSMGTSASEAE